MTPESPMETSSSEICAGSALRSTSLSTCLASSRIHLNFEALTSVRVSPHALHLPTVGRWFWFPASLSTSHRLRLALRVCPSAGAHESCSDSSGVAPMSLVSDATRRFAPGTARTHTLPAPLPPPRGGCPRSLTEVSDRVSPRHARRTDLSRRFVLVVFASPPTSPSEPDPVARSAPAGPRHLHVLHDGLRPRGLSPPRRLYSRMARACCSTAGRDSLRFPLLQLFCRASRHDPSFRHPVPHPGHPWWLLGPSGPRNAHTPRRMHLPDSRVDSRRRQVVGYTSGHLSVSPVPSVVLRAAGAVFAPLCREEHAHLRGVAPSGRPGSGETLLSRSDTLSFHGFLVPLRGSLSCVRWRASHP